MEEKERNPNIITLHQHTNMKRTIGYCETRISAEDFQQIILIAEGKAVNKCISITEILKRNHPALKQENNLTESPNHTDEPQLSITLSN